MPVLICLEESFPVCNLTIDTHPTFAVGNDSLLVHNNSEECEFVEGLANAPVSGVLRDSLMSLRNRVPSNRLTKAEMEQFAAELREFGVLVQYVKKYESGKDILRFMPGWAWTSTARLASRRDMVRSIARSGAFSGLDQSGKA